jgi:hypothetical protein
MEGGWLFVNKKQWNYNYVELAMDPIYGREQ